MTAGGRFRNVNITLQPVQRLGNALLLCLAAKPASHGWLAGPVGWNQFTEARCLWPAAAAAAAAAAAVVSAFPGKLRCRPSCCRNNKLPLSLPSCKQVPDLKLLERFLDAEDLVMGRCKDISMHQTDWEAEQQHGKQQ
jgi:hypothetical protein